LRSIRYRRLSTTEAEDLIILVSLITEAHQIVMPRLTSSWHAGRLDIVLTFETEAQRAAVSLRLLRTRRSTPLRSQRRFHRRCRSRSASGPLERPHVERYPCGGGGRRGASTPGGPGPGGGSPPAERLFPPRRSRPSSHAADRPSERPVRVGTLTGRQHGRGHQRAGQSEQDAEPAAGPEHFRQL
jgi:hypothetical protein